MRKRIGLMVAILVLLTLWACGGKTQSKQSGGASNNTGQSNTPAKNANISAADFSDALLSAGYMDEATFRSEYKAKYGDEEIDEVDDYDDFEWLDESGIRIPGLIKSVKASGALVDINHQLNLEGLNPVPQRYMSYAIFTEDYDPEDEDTVELILYCGFSSETQANDFYQMFSQETEGYYDNASIKGTSCVFYWGDSKSPAWTAMQKLGY